MISYIIGLMGCWLFADATVSIKLYWDESWLSCHSIRLLRGVIGVFLMVAGALWI